MSTAPSNTYQGFATAGAHGLITARPAHITGLYVSNVNAAIRYFQLWDRATDLAGGEVGLGPAQYGPAGGSLRVISFIVAAGSATVPATLELGEQLLSGIERFDQGIAWGWSSAAQTFTAGTAADHTVTVRWRAA
jgi:hypothetical protein